MKHHINVFHSHKQCHIVGIFFCYLEKILSKKKQRWRQYNREKSLRTGCILFKFLQRRAQNKILARQCVQCTKHTWLYSMLQKRIAEPWVGHHIFLNNATTITRELTFKNINYDVWCEDTDPNMIYRTFVVDQPMQKNSFNIWISLSAILNVYEWDAVYQLVIRNIFKYFYGKPLYHSQYY